MKRKYLLYFIVKHDGPIIYRYKIDIYICKPFPCGACSILFDKHNKNDTFSKQIYERMIVESSMYYV